MGSPGGDYRNNMNNRPPKPTVGVCKQCGLDDLVFHDDGSGQCMNCKRTFRWYSGPPQPNPHPATQHYGRYGRYVHSDQPQGAYPAQYPPQQPYAPTPYSIPEKGYCRICHSTELEFDEDGSGKCMNCGREFNWKQAEQLKQEYEKDFSTAGFYKSRKEIKEALRTGAEPEFIFNTIVYQGTSPKEANKVINEVLDELIAEKRTQESYLDSAIRTVSEESSSRFRRSSNSHYSRAPPPQPPRYETSYSYDDEDKYDADDSDYEDYNDFVIVQSDEDEEPEYTEDAEEDEDYDDYEDDEEPDEDEDYQSFRVVGSDEEDDEEEGEDEDFEMDYDDIGKKTKISDNLSVTLPDDIDDDDDDDSGSSGEDDWMDLRYRKKMRKRR